MQRLTESPAATPPCRLCTLCCTRLLKPGARVSAKDAMSPSQAPTVSDGASGCGSDPPNKAAFSPAKPTGPPTRESAPRPCARALGSGGSPREGGARRSCCPSSEGSKLHRAGSDACFRCHSALLARDEAPRSDSFPRLRGIGPRKRRIRSSSLWCIRVRSLKSTIYSNIDISTCQKRGALKFPLSTVVRRIARNVSDNS